jgi:hypothetical protein
MLEIVVCQLLRMSAIVTDWDGEPFQPLNRVGRYRTHVAPPIDFQSARIGAPSETVLGCQPVEDVLGKSAPVVVRAAQEKHPAFSVVFHPLCSFLLVQITVSVEWAIAANSGEQANMAPSIRFSLAILDSRTPVAAICCNRRRFRN